MHSHIAIEVVFHSDSNVKAYLIFVVGNHYENLSDASLGVAENVQSTPQTAPPTTERREELIKEVKTTRHTTPKTAVQTKKDSEEDARVKQVFYVGQERAILI